MIWPATEDWNFTPTSSGEPSFRLVCAGVLDAVNRLTVVGAVVTAILNVSLAARPPRSVAETLTPSVPTFAAAGVPLNVRVAALKLSQAGSGEPSAAVAV